MIHLGNAHYLWAYMYMRNLANHDMDLAYRQALPRARPCAHLLSLLFYYVTVSAQHKYFFLVKKTAKTGSAVQLTPPFTSLLYSTRSSFDRLNSTILAQPAVLLPVMYTPTVGEACQKFGRLPLYSRGCYVSVEDKGNLKAVLAEYAEEELERDESGKPVCTLPRYTIRASSPPLTFILRPTAMSCCLSPARPD